MGTRDTPAQCDEVAERIETGIAREGLTGDRAEFAAARARDARLNAQSLRIRGNRGNRPTDARRARAARPTICSGPLTDSDILAIAIYARAWCAYDLVRICDIALGAELTSDETRAGLSQREARLQARSRFEVLP